MRKLLERTAVLESENAELKKMALELRADSKEIKNLLLEMMAGGVGPAQVGSSTGALHLPQMPVDCHADLTALDAMLDGAKHEKLVTI